MPGSDDGDDTTLEQLDSDDTLTDPRVDVLDEGWSPNERPRGLETWGITPAEEHTGEPLEGRLRREEPDVDPDPDRGDGIGDTNDTDGEPYDDQVGDERAGRLAYAEDERSDEVFATDVGIDGAAASAEEAAVHLVPDETD
ncbi:MAG: DUF5709 domain-containing protein [Pseudonocardia sp.]|nr:DUF5709 domain-containing protein [Pseudonocardia sp.]